MSVLSTLGLAWLIFTAALAHIAIVYAAYQHFRRVMELAKRGEVEVMRMVRASALLEWRRNEH